MHLDDAFPEDKVDKDILNILAYLSRIVHCNPRSLNYGNGFMHTLNERGTVPAHKQSLLCIFPNFLQRPKGDELHWSLEGSVASNV